MYEDDQQVAQWLSDRRSYNVREILDALEPIKQPGLLSEEPEAEGPDPNEDSGTVAAAPIPMTTR